MRVYQYECTSPVLGEINFLCESAKKIWKFLHIIAPNGCLQFYMQASGQVQSFNYKQDVTNNNPNHLANLNYAICIRMESGFCGIRYSQVDKFSFTLSLDASAVTAETDFVTTDVKTGDTNCKNDYILIPGGSETGTFAGMNV